MANPGPTPIVPKVPASSLCLGRVFKSNPLPMSIVFAPSLTIILSVIKVSYKEEFNLILQLNNKIDY